MSWLLLLILASPARPLDSALVARIHALIESQAQPAPEVGLVLLPLNGRRAVTIEPDKVFHAASTMKVPVMIELFRQAKVGRLRLDDALPTMHTAAHTAATTLFKAPIALACGDHIAVRKP